MVMITLKMCRSPGQLRHHLQPLTSLPLTASLSPPAAARGGNLSPGPRGHPVPQLPTALPAWEGVRLEGEGEPSTWPLP